MCPEKARVVIGEDDGGYRQLVTGIVKSAGHTVVEALSTRADVLAILPRLKELGVNVLMTDGNYTQDDFSGVDGEDIVEAARREAPEVKIIGLSGGKIPGVDLFIGKNTKNTLTLGEAVTKLP